MDETLISPMAMAILEHQVMVARLAEILPLVQQVAERMGESLRQGGKILWMGNGGSAADSQHLAAELVGRFLRERRALPSLALTTDTSILTALGNDYGFETIFKRQVEALVQPGDVVVGLSTSGNSPNVLAGVAAARRLGAFTVGMSGLDGGRLRLVAHLCIQIPAETTARIQEGHILVGHMLCDWVEAEMTENDHA